MLFTGNRSRSAAPLRHSAWVECKLCSGAPSGLRLLDADWTRARVILVPGLGKAGPVAVLSLLVPLLRRAACWTPKAGDSDLAGLRRLASLGSLP